MSKDSDKSLFSLQNLDAETGSDALLSLKLLNEMSEGDAEFRGILDDLKENELQYLKASARLLKNNAELRARMPYTLESVVKLASKVKSEAVDYEIRKAFEAESKAIVDKTKENLGRGAIR